MLRIEIVANNAVQEDILEALEKVGLINHYTLIPAVHGRGRTNPKKGDHIWPEENFIMVIYCDKSHAEKLKDNIKVIKKRFPNEGIKIFQLGSE